MESQAVTPNTDNTITVHASAAHHSHFWAGQSFSFHDLLDTINPLQHLPVIGTLYRHFTGDTIGNVAEVVGDGLFGGLLGLASGAINVAVKEATGKDIGENLMALVEGHDAPAEDKAAAPAPDQAERPAPASPGPQMAEAAEAAPPDATTNATAQPSSHGIKPLPLGRGFLPIDTSDRGIMALKGLAATHHSTPVALNLPPGTHLDQPAPPVQPADFTAKMREGLDKYQALLAAQMHSPGTTDQVH